MTDPIEAEFFTHEGKKMVRLTSSTVPGFSHVRAEQDDDRERYGEKPEQKAKRDAETLEGEKPARRRAAKED